MCAELKRRVILTTSEANGRTHRYHAEATVLAGHLELPLVQEIKPQAYAKLPDPGGYLAQHATDYRLESVISFDSAYTQVTGNPDVKAGHGWSTLATSVVEKLNVLDVVTADRVVGQISVEHPLVGYVPHVTFLGTRFENLRIAGHPVRLDLDLNIFGPKPENDAPYSKAPGFLDRVAAQHGNVRKHPSLLNELMQRYTGLAGKTEQPEVMECSLVNNAEGAFPGRCFGHVIEVPNFGTIILAALRLEQGEYQEKTGIPATTTFHLTMIELKMGCIAAGNAQAVRLITNGSTRP
jgi:hypothetical protein